MGRFEDKVVLITGGSSGIGLEAARRFAAEGARLVLVGRGEAALAAARAAVGSSTGTDVLTVAADVARVEDLERVMAAVKARHGRIDALFANAGVSECPPLAETTSADFDAFVGINLKGVFFTFVKALPLLSEGAAAVFTATATHGRGKPGDALYLATKAAVRSLARAFAGDEAVLAKRVRVNVVSPGAVETPLTVAAHGDASVRAYVEQLVPLGRWGRPEEIASAVLFLCSAESSYVTGAELAVDGGLAQV